MLDAIASFRLLRPAHSVANRLVTTGAEAVDHVLGGGLAMGRMHELYAAQGDDAASAAGFALLLAKRAKLAEKPLIWVRQAKDRRAAAVYAPGLAELGVDPAQHLFVEACDPLMLLRAGIDAARCSGVSMVIMETRGAFREIDLTASRRMQLAAEKAGVTILLLRIGATVQSSAAETRWSVASAPSRPLDADAPGAPAFDVELLRQRAGPSGMKWRLEWNYEHSTFIESALPFPVVSLSVGRQDTEAGSTPLDRVA